jgi:putative ABC transport system ATP-binding protein
MNENVPVIDVNQLTKTYKSGEFEVRALRSVTLKINPAEFIAIMGASGSGKSTFMNIIGCLDVPTSGQYLIEGINVETLSRNQLAEMRNEKIGFIFQSFNILARTSALENVELPLLYSGKVNSKERRERALQCLKSVGLEDRADALPNQLSGGQQQRVAIARALVNNPLVILADEPTGNLDTRTSFEIMEIFQELNEKGITIVMVTHELDIAEFSTRKIAFKDGSLHSDKTVEQRKKAKAELEKYPVEESVGATP